ncbi:RNA cytidine acetyltransferase [Penicillium chermesinum]|uniref:RNA cytidine acetyltransferase n=1 Tax=Penicillium chermesinum TaxID=63820 RepID=A0A9W9PGL4_9EURO|nr:RNA cytidine acetyltransferase [Penicillium chermesinum]KAJ5245897.1 RNA cytidine acetyltransferase [Penicillium chermesinum]
MPRKAIDSRIPALIRNGVQEKKRSFFVIVGDRAKDVIVHLHYIMSSVDVKQNKPVLWAYKKDLLGFTSHRKKREAKIKKEVKRGIREPNEEDPFELFITLNQIRYVYYKETEKILGNTYGMCILQDFEAMTPNLLARTVETVEGGGMVLLLLKSMNSLKQLYTLSMDIHSRYRTEAHDDVVARFNERFILSLGSCDSCLVVDDELNVLPISGGKNVKPLPPPESTDEAANSGSKKELKEIKESLADTQPVGPLIQLARTVDQAKALLTFADAIAEKTLKSTVTLTAGRGRGKSAALGVAIASAVAHGYSNIFITSPSPENLKTLFEFVFKGFDALGYLDHVDYTILQSTNPDFNKAIVRVNIHRKHRQTIQYIQPQDAHVLGQAELLVIDEAAAIPLPLVRKLMGPYLVFMASTINGYEGTGRSLSLKLIQQLREQSRGGIRLKSDDTDVADRTTGKASKHSDKNLAGRSLREITLSEPIRYAPGDSVEKWLNKCQLLQVNRDTLFSFHPVSEKFLQQMMALYVASHYKNTPNDLQLMSDAPAHQLYVLVPPMTKRPRSFPSLFVLSRGQRAGGDLIPWLVSQQFQDEDFASLSGARVVRIATNPEYVGMGYGSRALELLVDFFEGKFTSLSEDSAATQEEMVRVTDEELANSSLLDDNVHVRDIRSMPPLFGKLSERRPDALDYLGVSYGLTPSLHKFWKRASFAPVYLRQTPNELTGEHSCVMLRTLTASSNDAAWLGAFARDFHRRFLALLSYQFHTSATPRGLTKADIDASFSPFDLKRLDSYANNQLDHHVILDLVPLIAEYYFGNRLAGKVSLSGVQQSILLAIGLQRKSMDDIEKELNLPSSQLLAMFLKIIRKVSTYFRGVVEGAVAETLPAPQVPNTSASAAHDDEMVVDRFKPLETSLEEDLQEDTAQVSDEMREKQRALIDALPLDKYEIDNGSTSWEDAEKQIRSGGASTVSVKSKSSKRKKGETAREIYDKEIDSKRQKMIKKGTEGRKK